MAEAVEISDSPERLVPTSNTFHGRDVFAPVAAALAAGEALASVGELVPVRELVRLELPSAHPVAGGLLAHVIHRDGFGNLVLDAGPQQLTPLGLRVGSVGIVCDGRRHEALVARSFGLAAEGRLLLYEDSWGTLGLAVNRGSAAELLGAGQGDEVLLETP